MNLPARRQQHLKPTPSYQVLQQLEWEPSVWTMYQGLLHDDDNDANGNARRYLQQQYKLDTEPRITPVKLGYTSRVDYKALQEAIMGILHPYQTPLTLEALWGELDYHHIEIGLETLRQFCNKLSDPTQYDILHRFLNPYHSRQYVFCANDFRVDPQVGDKVVELIRQRSRRFGTVVEFKLYRLNGKRYPVIQTETSRYFVDPERIIIVERLEPFAKRTKTKTRPHTSSYSLG